MDVPDFVEAKLAGLRRCGKCGIPLCPHFIEHLRMTPENWDYVRLDVVVKCPRCDGSFCVEVFERMKWLDYMALVVRWQMRQHNERARNGRALLPAVRAPRTGPITDAEVRQMSRKLAAVKNEKEFLGLFGVRPRKRRVTRARPEQTGEPPKA